MDSFYSRFKNPLFLLLLLVAQTLGLAVQVQRPERNAPDMSAATASPGDLKSVSLWRSWTTAVLTPFERAGHNSTLGIRHLWSDYLNLRHTHEQNAALQQEIARLRLEQAAFAEDAAQGRRLQSLLAFKQQYISATVAAQVIASSGSDRSRVLTLDKGADFGLKPNMPVITPDGVVGKLREVFPHTSQLLLLNDLTSGAGVTLESSRIRGILSGASGGRISINDLTADSRIKTGEHVVTSGGDLVYPRGLPVGIIESITPDPQHQPYSAIIVQPFANLSRLEEVLVITGVSGALTEQAKQDADQASATAAAEAERRAADIVAQRLPGLDKPASASPDAASGTPATPAPDPDAADRGGLPGIPNSGLPRIQPAVHPDRYSPGTAPPAADLKPGEKTGAKPAEPSPKTEPEPKSQGRDGEYDFFG